MPPTARKKTSKSGNPANRTSRPATNSVAAPAAPGYGATWVKGSELGPRELALPSGAVCLVAPPDLEQLIRAGVADKVDVLTPLVERELVKPVRDGEESVAKPSNNRLSGDELLAIYELADRIVPMVVVQPTVVLAPTPKCRKCGWESPDYKTHPADHAPDVEPRRDDVFYTDGISPEDKMAILAFAMGGPRAVANFPIQPNQRVAPVAAEQDLEGASE